MVKVLYDNEVVEDDVEDDFLLEDEFSLEGEDYGDVFLNFLDPQDDVQPEYIEDRVSKALEQYTLDELLIENDMEEKELVSILFELGYLGLPEFITYDEDNEEVQDREEIEED